jgi:hypothetical protein
MGPIAHRFVRIGIPVQPDRRGLPEEQLLRLVTVHHSIGVWYTRCHEYEETQALLVENEGLCAEVSALRQASAALQEQVEALTK